MVENRGKNHYWVFGGGNWLNLERKSVGLNEDNKRKQNCKMKGFIVGEN